MIILFCSCNKNIIPAFEVDKGDNTYDSTTYDYLYVEGLRYKLLGNYGDAVSIFQECLKINPQSDGVYFNLAQLYISGGDYDSAISMLKKAVNIDKKNIWYATALGSLYYQNNIIDSAIYTYEEIVKAHQEDNDLKLTLANLYSENNDYQKAVIIYKEFEDNIGVNSTTTIDYIRCLIQLGSLNEAQDKALLLVDNFPEELLYRGVLAEIYNLKGDSERAMEVYNDLINRNPDNPDVQISLFDFLLEEKKFSDLSLLLNKIIINDLVTVETKIILVSRILDDEDFITSDGEGLLLSLIMLEKIAEGNDIVVLLRPDLLAKMDRYKDAGVLLEEIIKENQNNYYAWEALLIVYLNLEDYVTLEEKAEICSKLFNRSFLAKILYATAASENANYSIALDELRKAEILAGNDKELQLQVLSLKADIYYRMGDFENSFNTFEEALKNNPNDFSILNNYAYYLSERDLNLKYAKKMAKRVISQFPLNTTYLDTYGWVLYKMEKYRSAKNIFNKIGEIDNNPDSIYFEHLGFIYKGLSKCELAIISWEKALELGSSNNSLKEEIQKCAE